MKPFGATSLHDAIARTAQKGGIARVAPPRGRRLHRRPRHASKLTASEVSGIASSIDVPVYVIGIVPSIDNPSAEVVTDHRRAVGAHRRARRISPYWTGGRDVRRAARFPDRKQRWRASSSTNCGISISSRSSASTAPGWHPLVVRMRDKDLTVRARSGYIAGQSRPISQ